MIEMENGEEDVEQKTFNVNLSEEELMEIQRLRANRPVENPQ